MTRKDIDRLQGELRQIQADVVAGKLESEKEKIAEFFAKPREKNEKKAFHLFWAREDEWINKFQKGAQEAVQVSIDERNKSKLFEVMREQIKQRFGEQISSVDPAMIDQLLEQQWQDVLIKNENLFRAAGIEFKVLNRGEDIDKDKLDNFLEQLGVNGVVFGHIHLQDLKIWDKRVFCVDVDEGNPGHLIFNGDGIRFNAMSSSIEEAQVSKSELLANIDAEIIRIKEKLGQSTIQDQDLLSAHSSQVNNEKAATKERLLSQQKEASFSKNAMRRFKLALNIIWGNGAMSLIARESTQAPGKLRIHDINILGPVGAILVRDEQGRLAKTDNLLIDEGDTLIMGRDDAYGTLYTFVTKATAFDVVTVNAAEFSNGRFVPMALAGSKLAKALETHDAIFVIVQRETPVDMAHFTVTRTFVNNPENVTVTLNEEARSETKIEPVIMARNEEEAKRVIQEITNAMEISPAELASLGIAGVTQPLANPTQSQAAKAPMLVGENPTVLTNELTPLTVSIIESAQKDEQEGRNFSFEELHRILAPLLNEDRFSTMWWQISMLLPYQYRYHLLLLMAEKGLGIEVEKQVRSSIKSMETEIINLRKMVKGSQLEPALRLQETIAGKTLEQLASEAKKTFEYSQSENTVYSRADYLATAIDIVLHISEISDFINNGILFMSNGSAYHVSGFGLSDIAAGKDLSMWPGTNNAFGVGVYSSQLPLLHYAGGEGLSLNYNDVVVVKVPVDSQSTPRFTQDVNNPKNRYINLHSTNRAILLKNIRIRKLSVAELNEMGAISFETVINAGKSVYLVEAEKTEYDEHYQERAEYIDFMRQNGFIQEAKEVQTPEALNNMVERIVKTYEGTIPSRVENALDQARTRLRILPLAAQLTRPIQSLRQHLLDLQNQAQQSGDATTLHRTLKLIAAAINNDATILSQRGPMQKAQYDDTLGRLDEFSTENIQTLINAADRGADYSSIGNEITELMQASINVESNKAVPEWDGFNLESPSAASSDAKETLDGARSFADELSAREKYAQVSADGRLNYYFSGSLGVMLLMQADSFEVLSNENLPTISATRKVQIPASVKRILAQFVRKIGDADFVPLEHYKNLPFGEHLSKGGGGPRFADLSDTAKKIFTKDMVGYDPLNTISYDVVRIKIGDKEYYITSPMMMFVWKFLHLLDHNSFDKAKKFTNDLNILLEMAEQLYTREQIVQCLHDTMMRFGTAPNAQFAFFNHPALKGKIQKLFEDAVSLDKDASYLKSLDYGYEQQTGILKILNRLSSPASKAKVIDFMNRNRKHIDKWFPAITSKRNIGLMIDKILTDRQLQDDIKSRIRYEFEKVGEGGINREFLENLLPRNPWIFIEYRTRLDQAQLDKEPDRSDLLYILNTLDEENIDRELYCLDAIFKQDEVDWGVRQILQIRDKGIRRQIFIILAEGIRTNKDIRNLALALADKTIRDNTRYDEKSRAWPTITLEEKIAYLSKVAQDFNLNLVSTSNVSAPTNVSREQPVTLPSSTAGLQLIAGDTIRYPDGHILEIASIDREGLKEARFTDGSWTNINDLERLVNNGDLKLVRNPGVSASAMTAPQQPRQSKVYTEPASLNRDISSLESEMQKVGIGNLPRVGIHGEKAGHQPTGDFWYFVLDPSLEDYWRPEWREDHIDAMFKLAEGSLSLNDVFIGPAEFFERLQGTIIFTAKYGGTNVSAEAIPEIYLLVNVANKGFVLNDRGNDKELGKAFMYNPESGNQDYRFFSVEGTKDASNVPPEAVVAKIGLTKDEAAAVANWAKTDRSGNMGAEYFVCRLLYKKALERMIGIAKAENGANRMAVTRKPAVQKPSAVAPSVSWGNGISSIFNAETRNQIIEQMRLAASEENDRTRTVRINAISVGGNTLSLGRAVYVDIERTNNGDHAEITASVSPASAYPIDVALDETLRKTGANLDAGDRIRAVRSAIMNNLEETRGGQGIIKLATLPVTKPNNTEMSPFGVASGGALFELTETGIKLKEGIPVSPELLFWNVMHEMWHSVLNNEDEYKDLTKEEKEVIAAILAFNGMNNVADEHLKALLKAFTGKDILPSLLTDNEFIDGIAKYYAETRPGYKAALEGKGQKLVQLITQIIAKSGEAAGSQVLKAQSARDDLRGGTADIITMPGSNLIENKNGQFSVERTINSQSAKKFGSDTVVNHYAYDAASQENRRAALRTAIKKNEEELINRITKGDARARHMVAVAANDKEEAERMVREIVKDMVGLTDDMRQNLIGRTTVLSLEAIPSHGLLDDANLVLGSKGLLNAKRYEANEYPGETLSPEAELRLVDFLSTIFDLSNMGKDAREIIRKILLGATVKIRPINLQTIREYQDRTNEVMRAL